MKTLGAHLRAHGLEFTVVFTSHPDARHHHALVELLHQALCAISARLGHGIHSIELLDLLEDQSLLHHPCGATRFKDKEEKPMLSHK